MIMGLAVTSVSAQATPAVTEISYNGAVIAVIHGVNLAFQPGDTTVTPQVLSSEVPFTVITFADEWSRDHNVQLGSGQAMCANTLTGQQCTLTIAGTNPSMWFDLVFAPAGFAEFTYAGGVIGRFVGANPVFQPGDTATAKVLTANTPFTAVNFANKNDLLNANPMGSIAANCNTLVGGSCTINVQGTDTRMWIAVQLSATSIPVVSTPAAVVATPAVAATPNPLLGQVGGANPGVVATLPAQAFPTIFNQWVFTNTPGSTNPRQAGWQQDLLTRVGLNPQVWVNNVPNADNAAANFVVARDGMEVAPGDMTYGEQDNYLNVYSAGGSIRYISADYNLPALGVECHAQAGIGCLLLIVNTGNTAVTFEDQVVQNGFSFEGVIFNQERTGTTVWAVASYGVARMMNMGGVSSVNQGSNCSITDGCVNGVMVRVVGHSGGFVEWTGAMLYHR